MYRFKIYFILFLRFRQGKSTSFPIDNSQTKPTQIITNEKNDIIVYVTPTGKRFHLKSTCAGKNAIKSFLSEIKADYTPCKKCAK